MSAPPCWGPSPAGRRRASVSWRRRWTKTRPASSLNPVDQVKQGKAGSLVCLLPNVPLLPVAGTETELDDSKLEGRDPKFLNYFLTVTKTYTFTTLTATSSLGSVYCTPAGWTMNACPGASGRKR